MLIGPQCFSELRRKGPKPENPRKRCDRGGLIAWFMHDEGKRGIARSGQARGAEGPVYGELPNLALSAVVFELLISLPGCASSPSYSLI